MIASATEPAAPPVASRRPMRHTISVLVDNTPGVLMKVAGLFRRRGDNIHSLAVGVTEQPTVSRMIIVVEGEPEVLEQIIKQLNKLMEVIKVNDVTNYNTVDRELALIKVNATPTTRMEIMEICNVFRANVVDLTEKTMTLEVTGRSDKIDAILSLVQKYGIREMDRTGHPGQGNPAHLRRRRHACESLLRARRQPERAPGQARGRHRVREPGPRPGPEPAGQRRRRGGGPVQGEPVVGAGRGRRTGRRPRVPGGRPGRHHPAADSRRDPSPGLPRGDPAPPDGGPGSRRLPRVQHPLPPDRPAPRRGRVHDRAQEPGAPPAADVRGGEGSPRPPGRAPGPHGQGQGPGPGLRPGHRVPAGRGH